LSEPFTLIEPARFEPRPLRLVTPSRRRRFRIPPAAVGGLVLVLALVAALSMVRVVEVQVDPVPDRVSLSGWPYLKLGTLRLMLSGSYTLRAEKAGYRPLEAPLGVTRDPRQVARFSLELLPGLLALNVTPGTGVRVLVDGVERGVTPLEPLEVAAGQHEIALRAEGYAPHTVRLAFAGGGVTETLATALRPDSAPVTVASDPEGASVRVDGHEIGRTPLTAQLTSGPRVVEVQLAGFAGASRRITVVAERPLAVPEFRLTPLPGRLQVTSEPAGAAVTVGGRFRGETPLELEVPAGAPQVVRATRAGHEAAEESVTLSRGESRPLHLTLAAQQGEVQVIADPANAEVLVDGQPRGTAGKVLELSAAPHEIEVRSAGYEPHRQTVTPRPGLPQSVRVRLRSVQEAKAVAKPAVLRSPAGHELRLLEGGRFQMGASRREPGRRGNETPREVELVRPYYLAVREVTNAQFRKFKPDHSSGRFGAYALTDDAQPVVQVTWEQAVEYCNWLSAQEGLPPAYATRDGRLASTQPLGTGYRLPTEAEWSRAARYAGGGPLKYPWGPSLPAPAKAGNFADESARPLVPVVLQGYEDRYPVSAPVGTFPPNALGFFDLGGNVAEWVHDVYWIPPPDPPLERDPTGPPPGDLHLILGSSYLHGSISELRLAYRDYAVKPRPDVGFRIARYAE
jgi:formylglycine-generating enzyme required for sulfatase activity